MNEVDIIRGAREILTDPNKWGKGQLYPAEGKSCVLGAMLTAAGGETSGVSIMQLTCLINRHIPAPIRSVALYNDDPRTTHADILNVLDKTLADLGGLG